MDRIKILVLFGGRSEEHDVSIKSAIEVAAHIDTDEYDPIYVGITKGGAWRLCDGPSMGWEERALQSVALSPGGKRRSLLIADGEHYIDCPIDVVFPVLHGKHGEDGAIQGLLELSGIPYVGCGIEASAICMDKSLTYAVASNAGILVPDHLVVSSEDDLDGIELEYPVFVKPARSGSSFGISKVERSEDLLAAVRNAMLFDTKALIEKEVRGKEIGCAILGSGKCLMTGELDQIVLSHGFFRIHQEDNPEDGSDNSRILVPADITSSERESVLSEAMRAYRAIGCEGLARVDMFLLEDGRVVLNEVNSMPGLTSYSRYPRMMEAAGLPFTALAERLIGLAFEKGER